MRAAIKNLHPQSKRLFLAALLTLIAAYIFGSLAIDRGNWLYYGLTLAAVGYGLHCLWRGLDLLKK